MAAESVAGTRLYGSTYFSWRTHEGVLVTGRSPPPAVSLTTHGRPAGSGYASARA